MSLLTFLFSVHGRMNRGPFWAVRIAQVLGWIACILFIYVFVHSYRGTPPGNEWYMLAVGFAAIVICALMIWSDVAISAKRLHDHDKSAWWLLLVYSSGVLIALATAVDHAGFDGVGPVSPFLHLAGRSIFIWASVELGYLRGTVGPNRFGPDLLPPVAVAEGVTWIF
jgi:uncharacterized membrane protein YhaH (DUF805 family)